MQILMSIFTILVSICFLIPQPVLGSTLDTKGDLGITCNNPYMETHSVSADGKSTIKFHGQCSYSSQGSAWNKHYFITATWDGIQAKEALTISGENKYGTVLSTCPSNPWLNKVACQKKSLTGTAFSDYQITGATTYPLTANVLSDEQRAQLNAELETKKKEAACASAVLVSPSPASGQQFYPPANVNISIKHNPDFPPKEWIIYWAPPTKPGDWPASPTKENITLTNLKTSGGVTTGTLNTSKVGNWQIETKVYLPATCNKGEYTLILTSFAVKEKSQAAILSGQAIKDKQYKPIDGTLPKPGSGPEPGPDWQQKQTLPAQQKQLQQQKLQQNLQQQKVH